MKRLILLILITTATLSASAQIQRIIGDSVAIGVKPNAKINLDGTITAGKLKVDSYITTIVENDTYPVTLDSLQQGGLQVTYNQETRNAIPMARRKEGMYVSYSSSDSLFKLVGGIGNGNWVYISKETKIGLAENRYSLSAFYPSLVSNYHSSEGMIINIGTDTLIQIFRLDTLNLHISNRAAIVKRYSYDKGLTWTQYSNVYNSIYDDRNIGGGITSSGRIVVFFRRYNTDISATIDHGYIYSDDGGYTWSSYNTIASTANAALGKMIKGGDGKYRQALYTFGEIEIWQSDNGSSWALQSNITPSGYMSQIVEPSIAYIGEDRMILLARDNATPDSTHFVYRSSNNGSTWQYMGRSKFHRNQIGVSQTPVFIDWDSVRNVVIAVSTQRHLKPNGDYSNAKQDSMYVYITPADSAYLNKWHEKAGVIRPVSSQMIFYGYPYMTQLSSGDWIGIVTDCDVSDTNEYAWLYQFDLTYNDYNQPSLFSNKYKLTPRKNNITGLYDYVSIGEFSGAKTQTYFKSNKTAVFGANQTDSIDVLQVFGRGNKDLGQDTLVSIGNNGITKFKNRAGYFNNINSILQDYDFVTKKYTDSISDSKESFIANGTISQYWRGDKSWQTLDKSTVGLGNVDNKSSTTIRSEITSTNVSSALGYTPYNPSGYPVNSGGETLQSVIARGRSITHSYGSSSPTIDIIGDNGVIASYFSLNFQINSSGTQSNRGYYFRTDGGGYSTGTNLLSILQNGNVLIGTSTDSGYKLNVNGTGNFSGTVKAAEPTASNDLATKNYVDNAVSSVTTGGGSYTPTISLTSGTVNSISAKYVRSGNMVTVFGKANVTRAGTTVNFTMSLPVSSSLAASDDIIGYGVHHFLISAASDTYNPYVSADTATDTARILYNVGTDSPNNIDFSFTYEIK